MHSAVGIADEGRVRYHGLLGILIDHDVGFVGLIDVLFLANVEIVVDEELAEGNLLLVFAPGQLVRDLAAVAPVDHLLVVHVAKGQMVDRVCEVNLVPALHQLHDSLGAIVRAQVEIARHLVDLDLAFDLAALLILKLPLCCAKDDVGVAIGRLLFDCIGDALDLAIDVEGVLVESAFHVHLVYTSHIDHIESQDGAWGLGQRQIDV